MKYEPIATEHQECKTFVQWADLHPNIGPYLFHIPNEGERTLGQRLKQKAEGLRRGVPDYMLAIPRGSYAGLFLEMKRSGTVNYAKREEQQAWIDKLNAQGYKAMFCYGANDGIKIVTEYMKLGHNDTPPLEETKIPTPG